MRKTGIDVEAPENTCSDKNCPWHGNLKLRGKSFVVNVVSTKAEKTAVVEWYYSYFVGKYERYERRKSRVSVHNPVCINAKQGEKAVIAECRPLSKKKKFCIVGRIKK